MGIRPSLTINTYNYGILLVKERHSVMRSIIGTDIVAGRSDISNTADKQSIGRSEVGWVHVIFLRVLIFQLFPEDW